MNLRENESDKVRLYHAHHSLSNEDIPFWLQAAGEAGETTLELGCGTGRVTIPLASEGQLVYGLDRDSLMLNFCKQSVPQHIRDRVLLFQANMTAFHVSKKPDAIISPCNTISTLTTKVLQQTLSNIYHHLRLGGRFAASLPNPTIIRDLPIDNEPEIETVFPHPLDKEPVQVSSSWIRDKDQITFRWFYDHLLSNGAIIRTIAETTHHLLPKEKCFDLLNKIGFMDITFFGDYDFSPYSSYSPHLILSAKK